MTEFRLHSVTITEALISINVVASDRSLERQIEILEAANDFVGGFNVMATLVRGETHGGRGLDVKWIDPPCIDALKKVRDFSHALNGVRWRWVVSSDLFQDAAELRGFLCLSKSAEGSEGLLTIAWNREGGFSTGLLHEHEHLLEGMNFYVPSGFAEDVALWRERFGEVAPRGEYVKDLDRTRKAFRANQRETGGSSMSRVPPGSLHPPKCFCFNLAPELS
ncbi:MAG: hypothetical protein ACREDR_12480 [Blastocatellia bacterium]